MSGIGGIVLAAGGSTRMGQPKQLLDLGGGPLVCAAVRAAREGGCTHVCVVTGLAHEAVAAAVGAMDASVQVVKHEHWQRGMGGSVRAGLAALPSLSAVIILACDQPAVDAGVVRALIEKYERTSCAIVASHYADTPGIPALFASSCFDELRELPDERGAKAVITADPERVVLFDFPDGALDLDTPGDVRAWQQR